ncbi:MAG: hypothetical protein JWQ96_2419 [Segetibacter sp.]|nr:hypothetical protein [Segetibacter sp.]
MQSEKSSIDVCLQKLKKLESDYNEALQQLDMNQLSLLRHKIKQQTEKLRTVKRFH